MPEPAIVRPPAPEITPETVPVTDGVIITNPPPLATGPASEIVGAVRVIAPPLVASDDPLAPVIDVPAFKVRVCAVVVDVDSAPLIAIEPPLPGDFRVSGAFAIHVLTLMAPEPVAEPMVTDENPGEIVARAVASSDRLPEAPAPIPMLREAVTGAIVNVPEPEIALAAVESRLRLSALIVIPPV